MTSTWLPRLIYGPKICLTCPWLIFVSPAPGNTAFGSMHFIAFHHVAEFWIGMIYGRSVSTGNSPTSAIKLLPCKPSHSNPLHILQNFDAFFPYHQAMPWNAIIKHHQHPIWRLVYQWNLAGARRANVANNVACISMDSTAMGRNSPQWPVAWNAGPEGRAWGGWQDW